WTPPKKAAAQVTAVDYGILISAIAAVIATTVFNTAPGQVVGHHLETAANAAALAHAQGNRRGEISNLSEALGAAKALLGMTSSCDACGEVRSDLQEIIGIGALLKSRV